MSDSIENTKDSLCGKEEGTINVDSRESAITVRDKKAFKTYKVILTYVQLTDEQSKIKRSIIENILKRVV